MKENWTLPKYYPRAQINGFIRWTCVYCCNVNMNRLQPTAIKLRCKRCEHILWHGSAFHIPAGTSTKKAIDETIPVWVDEDFPFDPLKFDPMPRAIFNPDSRIKQRGRVHMLVIHDNVFYTQDPIQDSEFEAEDVQESDV